MVIVGLLGSERVETTVANEGFAVVFISTTDEAGHVLNPSIVFFGRVILVFQEQEIDVMGSVTLRIPRRTHSRFLRRHSKRSRLFRD